VGAGGAAPEATGHLLDGQQPVRLAAVGVGCPVCWLP